MFAVETRRNRLNMTPSRQDVFECPEAFLSKKCVAILGLQLQTPIYIYQDQCNGTLSRCQQKVSITSHSTPSMCLASGTTDPLRPKSSSFTTPP